MSPHVVMVTTWLETIKNAYLAPKCAQLASMIPICALLQKLVTSNSWVDSILLVQQVWSQPKPLLVAINGTSVVVLLIVLLTLALFMKKITKNSVMNVPTTLTGISRKSENVILLLKNVLQLLLLLGEKSYLFTLMEEMKLLKFVLSSVLLELIKTC